MSRPATKTDLISAAVEQFGKLWKLIDSMTDGEQNGTFQFEDRDRNVRDVLVHLYEWHQLLLNWADANRNGEQKSFLPAPYNWKTYPRMNIGFWEKHRNTPLTDSKKMLLESHANVMDLIETFSNDELFARNRFPWTGGSTLGAYCVSATSSHYDWAMKKIKRHIQTSRGLKM
jgi:hypothetical protein